MIFKVYDGCILIIFMLVIYSDIIMMFLLFIPWLEINSYYVLERTMATDITQGLKKYYGA